MNMRRSQSINEATREPGQKLYQLAHAHGEPDGSRVIEHIGTVWADSVQHARTVASWLFFLPEAQLSAWELRS
jgi:hypothetical protein